MSDLTEIEIFSCLEENFRQAIEHCASLAILPIKGPTYSALRRELKLIEGACRQAAYWREDSRWLPIGLLIAEAHQRAGNWLRRRHPAQLFTLLSGNLEMMLVYAQKCKNEATGRRGIILPDALEGPHRETRPVGWTKGSGLILPAGMN